MNTRPATAPLVRVVGVGSHHGADAAGWLAIRRLQENGFAARFPAGQVVLSTCDAPAQLPALAEGVRLLAIVDALAGTDAPGTLHCLTTADLVSNPPPASSHALGVAPMLELIEALQGGRVHTVLLGIGVGNRPDMAATPPIRDLVDAILEPLADAVDGCIRRFLQAGAHMT